MKCKFCNEEMKEFTKSFVCCYNIDCPHRSLLANKREGANLRGYVIEIKKFANQKENEDE